MQGITEWWPRGVQKKTLMSEHEKCVPFQSRHWAWSDGFTSATENSKASVSCMSESVEDRIQGEGENTGKEEFGRPSVAVKTQERVPTTVSNPYGDQMTQLLQTGKVYESTDPPKGLRGSVLHFVCNCLGCIQRHGRPFQAGCLVFLNQHVLVSQTIKTQIWGAGRFG